MYSGNMGCQVFKREGTKLERFLPKNQILRIGVMERCQKLGILLENKVILKLILSKNVNNKLIFFISTIFDIEN